MKKILTFLQGIENTVLVVTFSIMVTTFFAQVVNRNVFKLPISWFEEAAVYSMIYMVLLGTEVGLRDGSQIAFTGVVDKLQGKTKEVVQIISKIIVVLFSAIIFKSSIGMLQMQIESGQTSPALKLPMTIPYAALTISFAIITLVQGATAILMIKNLVKPEKAKEEVKV
ncbi:hypothetical protein TSYNTROOL_04160 [Tepidanaerobacter syntrophicus]|uniref:TRAP transporter small permease n=1 Tax=Tepidanaerobacter syntrophicus TaxID=224999 RepID=UPI0022EDB112|nr:TRAP transporter small permease [Tepidanaerobacter syntrophicus]GLI50330.1 hypothetical protein TSYNTROOL_04160 [Tepidanaerobacter syntrophicus]